MKPGRKILLLLAITAAVAALGRLAPRWLPPRPIGHPTALAQAAWGDSGAGTGAGAAYRTAPADTAAAGPWMPDLLRPLLDGYGLAGPALGQHLKRRREYWELIVPKGRPIHAYALDIEKRCAAAGIRVVEGTELQPRDRSVEYRLEKGGRSLRLRASLGQAFLSGACRLAVVFTGLDSIDALALAALEDRPWKKTLVVDPHAPNEQLKRLQFTAPRNELLLELPMEPALYPYVNPGPHALYIHQQREEVERILSEDLRLFPRAKGFASKYGDRAVENQPLLDKLFAFTGAHGLVFLDLTGSPRSLSAQAAAARDAWVKASRIVKDGREVDEAWKAKAALARKSGEAILVLAYSAANLARLEKAWAADKAKPGEANVELVTFSEIQPREP